MRERGISTVAAVSLAALAGLMTAMVLMDWVVVDVQTHGPDGVHVMVPCPLLVPRIAAGFVPDEALEDATIPPEARAQREAVIAAVQALADAPDATFVTVESEDAHVEIVKEGDELRIAVDADDAVVRCNIPLDGVVDALEDWDWETADPGLIFDVLAKANNGDLVTVESEEASVRIAMW